MVGNFKQRTPPQTAAKRHGNLKHPSPALGANGHIGGMRERREGGIP